MPTRTEIQLTHQDGKSTNLRLVLNTLNNFLSDKKAITGVCALNDGAYFDPKYKLRFKSDHTLGRLEFYAPFHAGNDTFPQCKEIADKKYSQRGLNIYMGEYKYDGDESTPAPLLNSEAFITFTLHQDEHSVTLFTQLSQYLADQLSEYVVYFKESDLDGTLKRIY